MNIKTARSIFHITDLLARWGHVPSQQKKREWWYLSPLHDEKTPSFHVDLQKNIFYDFGSGEGGDVITLVKLKMGFADIKQTLSYLRSLTPAESKAIDYTSRFSKNKDSTDRNIEITQVIPISHLALFQYLEHRHIPKELAKVYLKEIHYTTSGRNFFALGSQNLSDGYEIRNKSFKGSVGKKDISFIEGCGVNEKKLMVFEGMYDFLAFLVLSEKATLQSDVLILNSLSMLKRSMSFIEQESYQHIYCMLDNDTAGQKATQELITSFPDLAEDYSSRYHPEKDIADYLTKKVQARE